MITYNHEPYIRQAIDGVLMQKTNFPIQLVIGEDCSSDNTAAIIKEYIEKYPGLLKVRFNSKNTGIMSNVIMTLEECTGKYIALCEGDDYWTDSYKLQKQVDFLEANEDFVICHHNMQVIYENDSRKTHLSNTQEQKEVTTIEDIALGFYISTASSIFRNGLIKEFPYWFYKSSLGDFMLSMLVAQFGKIKYFHDVMGVYRVHENGIWSKLPEFTKIEEQISILTELLNYFKTNKSVYNSLKIWYIDLCLRLIDIYRFNDENRKNAIIQLLNEVEPGYFYDKYINSTERYNNLYGSSKNLIKALIKKQLYNSKKYFLLKK